MKTPVIITILTLAAVFNSGTSVQAYDNWYGAGGLGGMGGMYGGYGGMGWGWGSSGGVGEIYSGMGNLVRAEGQRNVLDSQAAINMQKAVQENEKARSLHIENQQKVHAEKLKREREARARNAEDRQIAMESRARQQQFMDAHRPQPLSGSQLDPATGAINWPAALTATVFDDSRKSLQAMIEKFSKYGASNDLTVQISSAINDFKVLLRSQILSMPMPEYTESRRFLDSLAASVR